MAGHHALRKPGTTARSASTGLPARATRDARGPTGSLLQRAIGNRATGQLIQRCHDGHTCAECAQGAALGDGVLTDAPGPRPGIGQPLDRGVRAFSESAFGADFADVRVHTDPHAAATARDLHALAYTVGRDIFFAAGRYRPAHREGRRLLAHELTHVLQQRGAPGGGIQPAATVASPADDRLERQADEHATRALAGRTVNATPIARQLGVARVQRQEPPATSPKLEEPEFAEVPVTLWAMEDVHELVPPGYPSTATGLATHVLASGEMGWQSRGAAAARVFTPEYWSPMIPRSGTVVLERITNTLPRNLAARILSEVEAGGPLSWASKEFSEGILENIDAGNLPSWTREGFTEDQLRRIPELVRKYSAKTITPDELAVLRRAAAVHISESLPGSPLISYTEPAHDIQANLKKTYGTRKWRVAVEFDEDAVLDVSRANRFNEQGTLGAVRNSVEKEWLATSDSRGRIVSVQRGSGPPSFTMRHAGALRWAGRGMVGFGLGLSAVRIGTAAPEERLGVMAEEAGGSSAARSAPRPRSPDASRSGWRPAAWGCSCVASLAASSAEV